MLLTSVPSILVHLHLPCNEPPAQDDEANQSSTPLNFVMHRAQQSSRERHAVTCCFCQPPGQFFSKDENIFANNDYFFERLFMPSDHPLSNIDATFTQTHGKCWRWSMRARPPAGHNLDLCTSWGLMQWDCILPRDHFHENRDVTIIITIKKATYLTRCFPSSKVLFQNKTACKCILSLPPLQFTKFILFEWIHIYRCIQAAITLVFLTAKTMLLFKKNIQ